jgi:aminoglycoside phosphotransferase (APT) family kinase protein
MSELPREFSNLEVVRDNQRYSTYKAERDGALVFIKQAKAANLVDGIQRELLGLQAFRELAAGRDLGFSVPEVIMSGDDYIITSWVEGEPMDFDPKSHGFNDAIRFFASSLARVDMLTNLDNLPQAKFDMTSPDAKTGIDKLKDRLGKTNYHAYFDKALLEKGFEYLYERSGHLAARLTHADFTPGNILEYNRQRTLVDYESVSPLWPRFYDLVNLTFNRMVTEPELIPGCQQLIELYFRENDAANLESATPQMNTIAMLRSLALIWEHLTEPNEHHNTQELMTPGFSERLTTSIVQILKGKPFFESF